MGPRASGGSHKFSHGDTKALKHHPPSYLQIVGCGAGSGLSGHERRAVIGKGAAQCEKDAAGGGSSQQA